MDSYMAKVANGQSFLVIKRSRPVFRMNPPYEEPPKVKVNLAQWKKAAGMLKGRKAPEALKWQRQIRKEWNTIK